MLEKSDFEVLRGIIKEEVQTSVKAAVKEEMHILRSEMAQTEKNLRDEMKETEKNLRDEMKETEKNLRREFNARLDQTERLMLDEIGRTHKNLMKEIQKVDARVDRLEEYYRITHLEGDTAQILLERTDHLEKRLRVCERRLGIA